MRTFSCWLMPAVVSLAASSCSPSRSSLITGRYPHSTDAEQLHWPLPAAQVAFVDLLRAAGYWTGSAGKWHLGDGAKRRFDDVREADPAGYSLAADAKAADAKISMAKSSDIQSGCMDWVPLLRARPRDREPPHRRVAADVIDLRVAAEDEFDLLEFETEFAHAALDSRHRVVESGIEQKMAVGRRDEKRAHSDGADVVDVGDEMVRRHGRAPGIEQALDGGAVRSRRDTGRGRGLRGQPQ